MLPAAAGRTPPRIGLVARGNVARLDVAIAGRLPAPMRATLVLRGEPDPRWQLRADAPAFDPGVFTGADPTETPIAFGLRADGVGGRARLQGFVRQGDLRADIRPSQLSDPKLFDFLALGRHSEDALPDAHAWLAGEPHASDET